MQTIKEELEKTVENYLNTDKFRDKSSKDDLELSFGQLIEKTIKEALENGFKLGVEFAQRWISVKDELPEIKTEPLQVIGKLRINGQYETYFIEHEIDTLKKECSHWKYIELN